MVRAGDEGTKTLAAPASGVQLRGDTPRLTFQFEPLKKLLAEPNVRDLITAFYEELSPVKGVCRLNPNWEAMLQGERDEVFCFWTARYNATLVGFISFHLLFHLNYRDTLFAMDAGHFLAPAFRGKGRIGYRMWKSVEPALRARGAKIIMAHDNVAHSLMPFFLALDYEPRSTMFWKVIGDAQ